jgi:methionyl-tRNA formyltransferase
MSKIKVVFFSSSRFCLPILEHLITSSKYELVGVVSQPNWENRGKVYFNPITKFSYDKGLKIFLPTKINQEFDTLKESFGEFDLAIVASYGQIIGKQILDYPKLGCINWHPSLLPKYRGATPMQTAIYNGDKISGLSWIKMGVGMDDGHLLLQKSIEIEHKNFSQLSLDMGNLGSVTIDEAILNLENSRLLAQDDTKKVICKILNKQDAQIDPKKFDAKMVYQHVLAYCEFPKTKINTVAYGEIKLLNVKVLESTLIKSDNEDQNFYFYKGTCILKCKDSLLQVFEIQLENGRKISFR